MTNSLPKGSYPVKSCETEFEATTLKSWLKDKLPKLETSIVKEAPGCYTVVVPTRQQMHEARIVLKEARTEPIAGDLLRVIVSDDVLIKPGSLGVVEKVFFPEKNAVQVTFNPYTPWRYSEDVVQASGGPVRIVKLSKIKLTDEIKTVEENIPEPSPTHPKVVKRNVKVFDVFLP